MFNQYLTDAENQFYKILVILVKYWLSISLYWLYRVTQISTLVIFNQYLTDTKQYILETDIIGKIS